MIVWLSAAERMYVERIAREQKKPKRQVVEDALEQAYRLYKYVGMPPQSSEPPMLDHLKRQAEILRAVKETGAYDEDL